MKQTFYTLLLTFLAVTCVHAQVIINEISYNSPESGNDSLEYIELYNAGNTHEDLTGWHFTSGIEDTLPTVHLSPGQYFVTAINSKAMLGVFNINTHQWSGGALNNSGELIVLVDASGNLIDSVRYEDGDPWPLEADGMGPSLELTNPASDNNDGSNWHASTRSTGVTINGIDVRGTPGTQNSTAISGIIYLHENEIKMSPNPANSFTSLLSNYIIASVSIYAIDGTQLMTQPVNSNSTLIDLANLANGLFIIKASTKEGVWVSRLSIIK